MTSGPCSDAFLDFHRAIVLRKAARADRRRGDPPAGALGDHPGRPPRHLTLVERNWFPYLLDPAPGDVFPTSEEDAAASFALAEGETLDALADAYERACARSRELAARFTSTMSCRNRSSARCRCAGSWCT